MMFVTPHYERHKPETTILYQVVRDHLEEFFYKTAKHSDASLPDYVANEFSAFLECGILSKGFVRLKCESCKEERLLPWSCKKRGFCPSCAGRRMAEAEIHLLQEVLPEENVRQWVISLPIAMRFWVSKNRDLLNKTLTIVQSTISSFYKRNAKKSGIKCPETGSITYIQRAGSSINLHPHFHIVFIDGVYETVDGSQIKFHPAAPLTNDDVAAVVKKIAKKVIKMLQRKGYLKDVGSDDDSGAVSDSFQDEWNPLDEMMAASIERKISLGAGTGEKSKTVKYGRGFGSIDDNPKMEGSLCSSVHGFSIHANVFVKGHQRWKLARLIRYVARPLIATDRFSLNENGDIEYVLKSPWSDGTTAIVFSPMELLAKLSAIIPPPRGHLTRYFGVLGPNSQFRSLVVPKRKETLECNNNDNEATPKQKIKMAILLQHTFGFDLELCPRCGGKMKKIAIITHRSIAKKILKSLGLFDEECLRTRSRDPPAKERILEPFLL